MVEIKRKWWEIVLALLVAQCSLVHQKTPERALDSLFASGKISGAVQYSPDGQQAAVPFELDPERCQGLAGETMNLIRRDDKWYLYSF